MLDNPYTIKGGEKLSPVELITLYVNWAQWNKDRNRVDNHETCDVGLFMEGLCCPDHMAVAAEEHAFRSYFRYFDLEVRHHLLTPAYLKRFIQNFCPGYDIAPLLNLIEYNKFRWELVKPVENTPPKH